ncbi:MAG: DUF452 family protein, partial [Muribaculaceae bacterium]|nr:DUF452 family protein [Muribaculaceae bacterium]
MEYKFTVNDGNTRLLLIFAGWGMDHHPFESLQCQGYDIAVVWDYRNTFMSTDAFSRYEEVAVVAWSMGVWGASQWVPECGLPVTLTLAINGSMSPVSDTCGIPVAVYDGTMNGLNERSLYKFYRRMCGSNDAMQRFSQSMPQRDIPGLIAELQYIKASGPAIDNMRCYKALISTADAIFPANNLLTAWHDKTETIVINAPHMPNWQNIIDKYIKNKHLVARKFRNAIDYDRNADVQRRIAEHLWQLWQKHMHSRTPESLIEVGCGSGMLTKLYYDKLKPSHMELWDLATSGNLPIPVKECDAETAIMSVPTDSVDVVASSSTVQWFNSLPRFMQQLARVLRPGGLAVISTYGNKTFRELAAAGAPCLPYMSTEAIRTAVPDEFEILELHDGVITNIF